MGKWNRRDFLKTTCCSAAAGFAAASFSRFGLVNALAQNASDYKALVCVFLFGGNDSNNMVIPYDTTGYNGYKSARGGLALAQGSLLPVTPSSIGSPFAFHPRFAGMQSLFNNKHLAVLANVGTLIQPTSASQFRQGGVPVPMNLFSHSDQEAQMQTAILDKVAETGWAGRTADKIQSIYGGNFPIIISLAGTNIFCEGVVAQSIQSNGNPTQLLNGFGGGTESNARLSALQSLLTFDNGLSLIQAASTTTGNAIQNGQTLAAALATGTPLATQFPNNSYFASQLQQVAKIIQVRGALGLQRQIFFVSMGGFDTHSGQLTQQDSLFNDMNQSLNAFYQATTEMGVANNVTTFTLSDFGRTYQPNSDGTDHAWGSHHLIMGGAVKGGDFYGTFPTLAVNGPDDGTGRAGGFRRPRSTSTPRRWRHGSAWRRQTCRRFSRTWRTSRRRRWESWVRAAHPPTKETTPSRTRSLYFLRLKCGLTRPSGLRLPKTRLLQAPVRPPRAAADDRCARFARRSSRRRSSRRDLPCAESARQTPTGQARAKLLPASSNPSYRPPHFAQLRYPRTHLHTDRKFCDPISSFLKQFLRAMRRSDERCGEAVKNPANRSIDKWRCLVNESGLLCSLPAKTQQKSTVGRSSADGWCVCEPTSA